MGLTKERFRSRNRISLPGRYRAIKHFGGRSILSTSKTQVRVKVTRGQESSFIVTGKLHTTGGESTETILDHIIRAINLSRREQSDGRIARHGKDSTMDRAISYTEETAPELDEEGLRLLEEINQGAAVRKAARLAAQSEAPRDKDHKANAKTVSLKSERGPVVDFT